MIISGGLDRDVKRTTREVVGQAVAPQNSWGKEVIGW